MFFKIKSILKKGKDKNSFKSYRLVSIQPNITKIFETIILQKISPFIHINNILPEEQYGYKKYISVSNQHIDIQNCIYNALNDKMVICIDLIFMDLTTAFDLVTHKNLMDMLRSI